MPTPQPYQPSRTREANCEAISSVPHGMPERGCSERVLIASIDPEPAFLDDDDRVAPIGERETVGRVELADGERRILQYLGAALIMQWNTLPRKLQRELFDNAGSMDELLDAPALRAQIARFLHKHKNDDADSQGQISDGADRTI